MNVAGTISNPFIDYNKYKRDHNNDEVVVPSFDKTTKIGISISPEAYANLVLLASKYAPKTKTRDISALMERIGLLALEVIERRTIIDEESGISTEDCRQSGFDDALAGDVPRFLALFGNMQDVFQEAYVRGFLEGNFVKTRDSMFRE